MICPKSNCEYESSEQGVKIHYGRSHEGTISGTIVECDYRGDSVRKHDYRLERSEELFCSEECKYEHASEHWTEEDAGGWQGGLIEVECAICGEPLERKPYHIEHHDDFVCSKECHGKLHSRDRSGEDALRYGITGPDHPLYKEGSEPGFYNTPEWKRTRRKFIREQGEVCNNCGAEESRMHVHHINPISNGGEKFDEDNLTVLCGSCHMRAHHGDAEHLIEV